MLGDLKRRFEGRCRRWVTALVALLRQPRITTAAPRGRLLGEGRRTRAYALARRPTTATAVANVPDGP